MEGCPAGVVPPILMMCRVKADGPRPPVLIGFVRSQLLGIGSSWCLCDTGENFLGDPVTCVAKWLLLEDSVWFSFCKIFISSVKTPPPEPRGVEPGAFSPAALCRGRGQRGRPRMLRAHTGGQDVPSVQPAPGVSLPGDRGPCSFPEGHGHPNGQVAGTPPGRSSLHCPERPAGGSVPWSAALSVSPTPLLFLLVTAASVRGVLL